MHDEQSRNERWFARQLRDAAHREQPRFSELLHQRIMHEVRATASEPAVANRVFAEPAVERSKVLRRRTFWGGAAVLTAAAAILAMVVAARWFGGTANQNRPTPAPEAVAGPTVVPPRSMVQQPFDAVPSKATDDTPQNTRSNDVVPVSNYTLDDLSRDAQLTAHMLVDQLPFETPADEWGL